MRTILRYLLLTGILLLATPQLTHRVSQRDSFRGQCLFCTIAQPVGPQKVRYAVGYEYELLQRFAREHGCLTDIRLALPDESPLDTLEAWCTDIVVISLADSMLRGRSCHPSMALADSAVWVVGNSDLQKEVNSWLSHFTLTDEHQALRDRFESGCDPVGRLLSGGRRRFTTPYDLLLKEYSTQLGWDWRLLAALVWQESKFHIEARSHRGAAGLMQMMPETARRYGATDPLDPEDNLAAGVRYLARLERMFDPYAAPEDLPKFVLAAYNAGEGRLLDCIRYAGAIGKPSSTWDDIQAVIPGMREESILQVDTVRLGIFKGYETIRYVRSVDSLYQAYRLLAPSPKDAPRAVSDTIPTN